MKDYYKTLGVSSSASIAEIKKAYRALAFKYHPDKNQGDSISEARFKEIAEAYEILSDTSRRAAYDDDRWIAGMSGRTKAKEEITPAWLVNVCVQLNASLATMDTHRMSQRALQAYILLILDDAHIALLLQHNELSAIEAVINQLLTASKKLDVRYLDGVEKKLVTLANGNTAMLDTIDKRMDERIRRARWERVLPWFVIIVTLTLCACMYYFGALK